MRNILKWQGYMASIFWSQFPKRMAKEVSHLFAKFNKFICAYRAETANSYQQHNFALLFAANVYVIPMSHSILISIQTDLRGIAIL